jgi:hypothetical protein
VQLIGRDDAPRWAHVSSRDAVPHFATRVIAERYVNLFMSTKHGQADLLNWLYVADLSRIRVIQRIYSLN